MSIRLFRQIVLWLAIDSQPEQGSFYGAEIGVGSAATSTILLSRLRALTLYMVDSWLGDLPPNHEYVRTRDPLALLSQEEVNRHRAAANRRVAFAQDRAVMLHGDSVDVSRSLPDGILSFVFFDANHSREAVKRECVAWIDKIRSGGTMMWHNYGGRKFPGVRASVDEFAAERGLYIHFDSPSSIAWTRTRIIVHS